MKPRTAKLALVAVLAGATTAPACNFIGISPAAAQAPNCGGNSTLHPAPIDCINTLTVSGIRGTVRLVVDNNGKVFVTATVQDLTPNTPLPPLFLQVKAHVGISSNPGFVGATDVFDGNTASVELQMPACEGGQVDIKIAPGQPTLDHIAATFRVAAPLVSFDCAPETTVPTTAPVTTAPTSAPATTVPETSPTSAASGGGSTTAAPTASSVAGGTIPSTGPIGDASGIFIAGVFLVGGAALVLLARRSPAS